MAYRAERLPSRFPEGTKFVIEGRATGPGEVRVVTRYVELPDGTRYRLPRNPASRNTRTARRRAARPRRR